MGVTVKLQGLRELEAALGEFKTVTARSIALRAAKKTLQPMAEEAQAGVPDDPATPQKIEIAVVELTSMSQGSVVAAGFGPTRDSFPEAGVQEHGAPPHTIHPVKASATGLLGFEVGGHVITPKAVQHPGSPPRAYMRRAWEHGAEALLPRLRDLLRSEIDKAAKRAAARALKKTG